MISQVINLPFTEGDTILELGGGNNPFKANGLKVVNIDKRAVAGVDIIRDLESDFSDIGQFDGVFAQYIGEHISWINIPRFFKSCFNVLKQGKSAVFILPNLLEQAKILVGKEDWGSTDICMVFGGQDYIDNTHKSGWSPKYVTKQLQEAGFSKVEVQPHPSWIGDMIVMATKANVIAEVDTKMGDYNRSYFEGKAYVGEGYRNFPVNYRTVDEILKRKPESVIEFGGARGYVCKLLESHDITASCVDVSEHCFHTRAVDNFQLLDVTDDNSPILLNDGKLYDLCFSKAFFEHVPEDKVEYTIRKSMSCSKRGFHGITFTIEPNDVDATHRVGTIKPKEWWLAKFKSINPDYPVEIVDKEELERGDIPIPSDSHGFNKLNLGSYTCMFHYGWINVDKINLGEWANKNAYRFITHDLVNPMPVADNSVDAIVMHHLIEQLSRAEGSALLKECYRVMKAGSKLRISTPDLALMCSIYNKGNFKRHYQPVSVEVENSSDNAESFLKLVLSGKVTLYDPESMMRILESIGFQATMMMFNVSDSDCIQRETIDSFPTISFFVEATKPLDAPVEPPKQQLVNPILVDKLGEFLNG